MPRPSTARLRRLIPGRTAVALIAAGLVGAGLSFVAIGHTVDSDEQQLLQNRTTAMDTVLATLLSTASDPLKNAAVDLSITGPAGLAAAANAARPEGITTVAVLQPAPNGFTVAASTGTIRVTSAGIGGTPAPGLAAAAETPGVVQYIAAAGSTENRTLAMAVGLGGGTGQTTPSRWSGWVLYAELHLPPLSVITSSPQMAAFPDIAFALYVGPTASRSSIILATTPDLPLSGQRATDVPSLGTAQAAVIPASVPDTTDGDAGPGDLLLVVAPRGSLAGALTDMLPWVVAGTILLSALLFAAVVDAALRRRDQAVLNARRVDETNSRLQLALDAVEEAEGHLRHQAFHDPLTNLANRALFTDRMDHAILRGRRHGERCAVLLLDLDDFKGINDSLGHGTGDALLVEVAYRVNATLRQSDTAARLGGDEFAVLIEDAADACAVTTAAQRLVEELALPYDIEGGRILTSVSIGIAIADGESASTVDLLRSADIAMYAAKAAGKGRWELYERSRHHEVSDGLTLQNELPRALVEGEFAVVYQPQVDIRSGTITGVEALVRWNHPQRGLIAPDTFIPLAERTSLINQLDEWVLETACRQVQSWREQGLPAVRVAVNVSGRDLEDDDRLVTAVARTLETTGIRPGDVEIELTESVAVAQHERALAILRRLRQLRVQVAIDDFGTGYSAFARLRGFPPDRIKIDREFVSGIAKDANDAALVAAMISMGHSIGMAVLAEGVESQDELEFLAEHGCDEVQGYLFSRPLPAAELEELLRHPERIAHTTGRWAVSSPAAS